MKLLPRGLALAVLLVSFAPGLCAEPLPVGTAQRTFEVGGTAIEVHTYKPERYEGAGMVVSLHGLGRNVAGYRDYAVPIADRHGLIVVAPLFDRGRFPVWRYQTGGLVRDQKAAGEFRVEPGSSWTGQLILDIVDAVRAAEGRPDLPYYLIGHSAGGQALSRFAAFTSSAAKRIVIANPSTYLWPTREERFPYGLGGLPDALSNDAAIRRYLAQPVTILLGTADIRRDGDLNVREGAERQGMNRYERGINTFHAAQQAAKERGWAFNWRLVAVPGVGHSARRMFASPQAAEAFSGN